MSSIVAQPKSIRRSSAVLEFDLNTLCIDGMFENWDMMECCNEHQGG